MTGLNKGSTCNDCVFSNLKNKFSDEDICNIEQNRGETSYSTGDIIAKQGTFISQILYLKTGLIKVVLEGKNDRNTILKIIEGKNFIALPTIANPDVYPFSVIAMDESHVCVIRKETFLEIFTKNKIVNEFLLKHFHSDYLYLYNRIATLSTRNNHGKLASTLIYLSSENFKTNIFEKIARKDLAQLSSISIESTNKILMEFKNDGLINIKKSIIQINKPELIEHISTVG